MNAPVVPLKNIGTLSEQAAPPLSEALVVNALTEPQDMIARTGTIVDGDERSHDDVSIHRELLEPARG